MYKGMSLSVRGYSHIQNNSICQDSSDYKIDAINNWAIAVVADGHGGSRHFRSDKGSSFAVESAIKSISDYLTDFQLFSQKFFETPNAILHKIEANIMYNWNETLKKYDEDNYEFTDEEKEHIAKHKFDLDILNKARERIYGTTLVVSVMSKEFCFSIQLGDGSNVALYNDNARFNIEPDYEKELMYTESMCDARAIDEFKHSYMLAEKGQEFPRAMIVSTDGLINTFITSEDFLSFNKRLETTMHDEEAMAQLESYLNYRSKESIGDDISISMIYDTF